MPCLGQCLNLGTVSNDKDCRHCGATGHTVNLDWHVACTLQIVNVRTQPSVKQRCTALDPSSPQAVTDQVARTSSDGFLKSKSGV